MAEKTPKWKSIKIPEPLHEKIKTLAKKTHMHMYQVIQSAIEQYDIYLRRPYRKTELPRLDKCAWYIFKLSQSVGIFKEKPTKENYEKLMRTIDQIEERIGVDVEMLRHVVLRLNPGGKKKIETNDKIELNDTTKLIIADIIVKMLFEEEEEGAK